MHKITKVLKNNEIVREVRGSAGGFMLKKDPDDLSVLTILRAFEKTMNINRCLEEDAFCSRNATVYCVIRKIYAEIQEELYKRLDIKLSTFLEK